MTASTELYISALKDQYNCNCTIITNVPLSLTLCSTELCEDNDHLVSVKLNDTFYIKAEITDPENRNRYNLSPNSVYLCMSGIYSTTVASNVCINFIDQAKLISSLPGQIIIQLGAYIVGDIAIKVITLLEPITSRILATQSKNGVVSSLNLTVTQSSSSGSNSITYIIIFSSIGGVVIIVLTVLIIFFCTRNKDFHSENNIKLEKDTIINLEKNPNVNEDVKGIPKIIKIEEHNQSSTETNERDFVKTNENNYGPKVFIVSHNI